MIPVALRNRAGRLIEFSWVDDADYPEVSSHVWRLATSLRRPTLEYARRGIRHNGHFIGVLMHRELLGLRRNPGRGCNDQVDHINRNGLDNRRSNITAATCAENLANKNLYRSNTSGIRGVSYQRSSKKWIAQIQVNGKQIFLGRFATAAAAAAAYHAAQGGQ